MIGVPNSLMPFASRSAESVPSGSTMASQLSRDTSPRKSSSPERNISHCVDASSTTRNSSVSNGLVGISFHHGHEASRVNTIRWLRHHSARRYGPVPTACSLNFAPYFSTASRGTAAQYAIAVSHGKTCSGFLSVMRTVRASTASTFATGSMVHMPLEALDLSASRASEYFTSSAVTWRPFPSGKHGSSWKRVPSRMRYV